MFVYPFPWLQWLQFLKNRNYVEVQLTPWPCILQSTYLSLVNTSIMFERDIVTSDLEELRDLMSRSRYRLHLKLRLSKFAASAKKVLSIQIRDREVHGRAQQEERRLIKCVGCSFSRELGSCFGGQQGEERLQLQVRLQRDRNYPMDSFSTRR